MLGSSSIVPAAVMAVLAGCPKLRLLDVSFCRNIEMPLVEELRTQYPQVHIKKSFTM